MATIDNREFILKNGRPVIMRSPESGDVPVLLAYLSVIFNEHDQLLFVPGEFMPTVEQETDWVREHAESAGSLVLCAFIGNEVVGVLSTDEGGALRTRHTTNMGISLRLAYTGSGLGTFMLEAAIDWARNNPVIEIVHLSVFSTNENALRLYKRMGFKEEGRRQHAIKTGKECYADEILLRLDV